MWLRDVFIPAKPACHTVPALALYSAFFTVVWLPDVGHGAGDQAGGRYVGAPLA